MSYVPTVPGSVPSYVQPVVRPRSPLAGIFLNLLLIGAGTMYAGRPWRGLAIIAAYLLTFIVMLSYQAPIVLLVLLGIWIFALVDGYRQVKRWNMARGIAS